ncbi:hypothetical protein SODG_006717 [Sodalis praecaptivus]
MPPRSLGQHNIGAGLNGNQMGYQACSTVAACAPLICWQVWLNVGQTAISVLTMPLRSSSLAPSRA